MQEFFLVIDTETSGLPKDWNAPYSKDKNWPHIVQIAWVIYDSNFKEIKRENHFIMNTGFTISKSAEKIHGITEEYLQAHGEALDPIMDLVCNDIRDFKPLIIGHFIELDYHMMSVELFRLGRENVFQDSIFYCTMLASAKFANNAPHKHLKLGRFYNLLFNEEPLIIHNALADVLHTARIFFYLINKQKVSLSSVYEQKHQFNKVMKTSNLSTIKRILNLVWHGK